MIITPPNIWSPLRYSDFYETYGSASERESVISAALDTPEGRVALAQAMTEPIRRALEYQQIGRRLLLVDDLPQGALARYERDVEYVAHVIERRSENNQEDVVPEDIDGMCV